MATEYPSSPSRELADTFASMKRRIEWLERRSGGAVIPGGGEPTDADGLDGDWWVDDSFARLYGPKGRVNPGEWPDGYWTFLGVGDYSNASGTGHPFTESSTAPGGPAAGAHWFDTDTRVLRQYTAAQGWERTSREHAAHFSLDDFKDEADPLQACITAMNSYAATLSSLVGAGTPPYPTRLWFIVTVPPGTWGTSNTAYTIQYNTLFRGVGGQRYSPSVSSNESSALLGDFTVNTTNTTSAFRSVEATFYRIHLAGLHKVSAVGASFSTRAGIHFFECSLCECGPTSAERTDTSLGLITLYDRARAFTMQDCEVYPVYDTDRPVIRSAAVNSVDMRLGRNTWYLYGDGVQMDRYGPIRAWENEIWSGGFHPAGRDNCFIKIADGFGSIYLYKNQVWNHRMLDWRRSTSQSFTSIVEGVYICDNYITQVGEADFAIYIDHYHASDTSQTGLKYTIDRNYHQNITKVGISATAPYVGFLYLRLPAASSTFKQQVVSVRSNDMNGALATGRAVQLIGGQSGPNAIMSCWVEGNYVNKPTGTASPAIDISGFGDALVSRNRIYADAGSTAISITSTTSGIASENIVGTAVITNSATSSVTVNNL